MKKILGLDLGTNSIGWALVEIDHEKGIVKILGIGSRILPMDAGEIKDFESSGKIKSSAAQRTEKRGTRRLNERFLLRRDRLHLVLNLLDALPKHYKLEIDFTNNKGEKSGQFKENSEPKLAYLPKQKENKAEFLFMDSFQEMIQDIGSDNVKNEKGKRIPYDWTLYYLRQKALSEKISLEEFAWVLLSYNQKRGYEKTEAEDKTVKEGEFVEEFDLRVKDVIPKIDKTGKQIYEIHLEGNDNFVYNEISDVQMTFKDDLKEIIKTTKVDEQGNEDKKKTEFTVIDIYTLKIKDVKYEKADGKHKYTLTYQNGWKEEKPPKKEYTSKYQKAIDRPFDYIAESVYDINGGIKKQQGKDRKLREPDFSDNSNDWTLLKKKTEKETLSYNIEKGYKNSDNSAKKYISPKIYDILKNDAKAGKNTPNTKIIGGMFQVVDRDFYREELNQIIDTQKQFHYNLTDKTIFEKCVNLLYPKNENHRKTLLDNKNAIQNLLLEDILLYQRPLKSKKSEISNCKYEIRYWKDVVDKNTGEITDQQPIYRKVVSSSHPYFQEFRIWDKLHNLKLIQLEKIDKETGEIKTNVDVTTEYIKGEAGYYDLFKKLNNQKSLNQTQFLKHYKLSDKEFVWNFPEDEELKGNETRVSFATRFKRYFTQQEFDNFLTQEKEFDLWHYLYSVSYKERTAKDKDGKENKSLRTFFNNFFKESNVSEEVKEKLIIDFAKYPKFASKYCAYSEKALKKLLPQIRLSDKKEDDKWINENWYKEWQKRLTQRKNEILYKINNIDFDADKIDYSNAIIVDIDQKSGELPFPKGLFNAFRVFSKIEEFKKLNLTQASYLVYGRHSELAQAKFWNSPKQIREELHKELKQHSLNNPVAEKVLLEMMQIVADIWDFYGKGAEKFFSKIHVEVGRELKKTAKEKDAETKRMSGNRTHNNRLRQILEEFLVPKYNAKSGSKDHFERLKIVEEGAELVKNFDKKFFDDKNYDKKEIDEILKKPKISKEDFEKYKLWIEQGYRSPYSGKPISLSNLFDGNKYNIDHIFPQALITNNSLSNKVVVEVTLNQLKKDRTARAFIQEQKGQAYNGIPVCSEDEYLNIVNKQFSGNKKFILLSKDIPKGFTSSQLNNVRHIARKAMELLSHIVREPGEVEFRSKNVLPVTGMITTELKRAWKLDQVWTKLVSPRFIRMNELTQSKLFGDWQTSKSGHEYFDCNLDEEIRKNDESYDIKRIDHRHHALDALIVALCTEEHVNYINNINSNAKSENYGKQKQIEKYRQTLKRKIKFTKRDDEKDENNWYYMLPGELRQEGAENSRRDTVLEKSYSYKNTTSKNYKEIVLEVLQDTIVTFKQNLRVINKTVNNYKVGNRKSDVKKQEPAKFNDKSDNKYNWAIRRSLGKGTYYGKVDVGDRENKQLHNNAKFFYENIDAIVDEKIKSQLEKLKKETISEKDFEEKLKLNFKNKKIECIAYKAASRFNSQLNTSFNTDKIETITDKGIQKILKNHLEQFDTIELPFDEAIGYFDELLEKEEFKAIVNSNENDFKTIEDFIRYLRLNKYKYNKTDYSKLNVFIEKVTDRKFRNEKTIENEKLYKEHPEIAFTPEEIENMNKPENLRKLNVNKKGQEKNHKPIYKVRTYTGFNKQRAVNDENKLSVKSKQFVVNDDGSNLYLGVYERNYINEEGIKITERKFKDIGLIELIETLKQDKNNLYNPLSDKIFDEEQNEFTRIFSLSPLDLVYVPTKEEIEDNSLVNFENLTKEQNKRIFNVNDFSATCYFYPNRIAKAIFKKEVDMSFDVKKKKIVGSFDTKTASLDGVQIKNVCWKLKVNRLGKITGVTK
ncbi:MAG: hypothetical protein JXL97_10360 [Bacteroidales bacterium]|nr:hypothetical protein [Bacteroidales bacterium]